MTQREFFNIIINGNGKVTDKNADGTKAGERTISLMENGALNTEITAYVSEQLTKLDDRNANRKDKPTEKQKKLIELSDTILAEMETEVTYTAGQLAEKYGVNTQTITPAMKRLVDSGAVEVIDKYKPAKGKSKCKGYIKK